MEDALRACFEENYLRHILLFVEVENPDSTFFGTLVDSWYAYDRGGIFIKSTNNPRTLNNPSGRLELEAMRQLPVASEAADAILQGQECGRLIKDHVVPRAWLRKMMVADREQISTVHDARAFLKKWYRVAALTVAEHDELKERKLGDVMPEDWDGGDCYARYRKAGFRLIWRCDPALPSCRT